MCTEEQALRNQGFEELTAFPTDSTPVHLFSETTVNGSEEQAGSQQRSLPSVLALTFPLSCNPSNRAVCFGAACLFVYYYSGLLKGALDTSTE